MTEVGTRLCGFRRVKGETTVRQNMGKTLVLLWWSVTVVTEVTVKILGNADSRR